MFKYAINAIVRLSKFAWRSTKSAGAVVKGIRTSAVGKKVGTVLNASLTAWAAYDIWNLFTEDEATDGDAAGALINAILPASVTGCLFAVESPDVDSSGLRRALQNAATRSSICSDDQAQLRAIAYGCCANYISEIGVSGSLKYSAERAETVLEELDSTFENVLSKEGGDDSAVEAIQIMLLNPYTNPDEGLFPVRVADFVIYFMETMSQIQKED